MAPDSKYARPAKDDPLERLLVWRDEARAADLPWPDGCCLATADGDGRPDARMIIFKGFDDRGRFLFGTNYESAKGGDLDENPRAAIVFWWASMDRQVRVRGQVEKLDGAGSDAIHAARPRGSQLSVWTSAQSRPIESREALVARRDATVQRFDGVDPVPRPGYWGGYALTAEAIEFWQGHDNRLHHRELYERDGDGWMVTLLQP